MKSCLERPSGSPERFHFHANSLFRRASGSSVPRSVLPKYQLHPVLFEQSTDIAHWFLRAEPDRPPGLSSHSLWIDALARRAGKPERLALIHLGLQSGVCVEPLRDHCQNLLAAMDPSLGPESYTLKRSYRGDEITDRHRQRLRQIGKGIRSRHDRSTLGGHRPTRLTKRPDPIIYLAKYLGSSRSIPVVNVHQAKTHLSCLLAHVEAGEEMVTCQARE